MAFLSLIVVLLLVQWWGSGGPLQKDGWFYAWNDVSSVRLSGLWLAVVVVLIPCMLLAAIVSFITIKVNNSWLFFINIPVLLYSLGRGHFINDLKDYLAAANAGESVKAAHLLDTLNLDPGLRKERQADDWVELNAEALRIFGYRAFERMFAVLFWFFCLGAVGALFYRLSILYWERLLQTNNPNAGKVGYGVSLLEWPAARLIVCTWALVGNFDHCLTVSRPYLYSNKQSTPVFLVGALRGALGDLPDEPGTSAILDETQTVRIEPRYSLKLVSASQSMFSRSLLLWVFVFSAITIFM